MSQHHEKTLTDYINAFKRRKWQMILPASLIFGIAIAIALSLPALYRSQATILIKRQDIPTDLVRTTVTGYADEQLQLLSQQVMTTVNLLNIIKKYELYQEKRKTETTEEILTTIRGAIKREMVSADVIDPRSGRPGQATIAFMLSYESASPALAQKVTNELVTLYLNENLKSRSEKAAETSNFLAEEANRLSEILQTLEEKLAAFKKKNINQLPELTSLNLQLLQRTEQEVAETKREISLRRDRKIYLESELAQLSPNKTSVIPTGDRLKALEMEYLQMAAAYHADHPDVAKLRREISLLKSEMSGGMTQDDFANQLKQNEVKLSELNQKYEPDHPEVQQQERLIKALKNQYDNATFSLAADSLIKPDNPFYIQLKAQLDATDNELLSLKTRLEEKADALKLYETRLTQTPQVEREYRQLTRNYENVALKYREISGKQIEAELAEQLEKESKGDRLFLIEPPLLPEKPSKPNRIAIMFLGFVFAIGGGIGLVAILESMDRKIRGSRHVSAVLGVEPLVVVPYIRSVDEQKRSNLKKGLLIIGVLIIGVAGLAGIHVFYRPLDILWFMISDKLGMAS